MLIHYFRLDFRFLRIFYFKENPLIWMSLQMNYGHNEKTNKQKNKTLTIHGHKGKSVYSFIHFSFYFKNASFHLIHKWDCESIKFEVLRDMISSNKTK